MVGLVVNVVVDVDFGLVLVVVGVLEYVVLFVFFCVEFSCLLLVGLVVVVNWVDKLVLLVLLYFCWLDVKLLVVCM